MPVNLRQIYHFLFFIAITPVFIIISSIPVKIALTQVQVPQPQAIFMLGGDIDRYYAIAKFAQKHPKLPIWLSVSSRRNHQIFAEANINTNRLHYDTRATDTVTNFTTVLEPLQKNDIRHVYLITSDYHMARSRAIATVVFGSRGIIVTPVPVSSQTEPEPKLLIARDVLRSIIWLFTGLTGAHLNPRLSTAHLVCLIDSTDNRKDFVYSSNN